MADEQKFPPLVYAVWVQDTGWLRDQNRRIIADPRREMLEEVLSMYHVELEPRAEIRLFDDSMLSLEQLFKEREKLLFEDRKRRRIQAEKDYRKYREHLREVSRLEQAEMEAAEQNRWHRRLGRWINGLLGFSHPNK